MDNKTPFNDDAYEELLNAYSREEEKHTTGQADLHNVVERHTGSAKPQFKVNIQGFEEEGQRPREKTLSPQEQRRKQGTYYQPEKDVQPKRRAPAPQNKKAEGKRRAETDGLTYDDEFGPIITRSPKKQQIPPVHRQVGGSLEEQEASAAFAGNQPVIMKKGAAGKGAPAGKTKLNRETVIRFFTENKKTWIIVAVCFVCAVAVSSYIISCMNDVLAIRRDSETVVTVTIPAEIDTMDAIDILSENNLIKHKLFCKMFAKIMKYRDDNYLTGIYYVTESMGVEKMLSTFKSAPERGETVTLTFPEGYTIDQIAEKLDKYEVCESAVFYKTLKEVDFSSEYSFIADAQNKEQRYQALEGYMYPDTYEFYKGENASSIIRKFLDNFKGKWTEEYQKKADALNMSVDDIIRIASIIEKEAANAEQMPLVSSVLHNRLGKPGLYPSLQCDATIEYVNEYIQKHVTNANELALYASRYSTYKCEGLPVGSICNPGDDAINGALNPANTDYFFFAHDNKKKLYLARNDSERQANSIAILQANRKAEQS